MKTKFTSFNLLDELQHSEYAHIRSGFKTHSYSKGQLIYAPGHENDLIFIIQKGKVRIYLAMEDKEFSLAILEPGDIYATHTRAHVLATEDVELLTMETGKFYQLMIAHPAFSKTIISILGELLKQSFSIIDSLVFKDISSRLVDFFLYEAEHHGRIDSDGIVLDLDLTMEQLAAIIGSSRQTVSTIINDMQRADVLRKKDRGIFLIPSKELLKNFSVM